MMLFFQKMWTYKTITVTLCTWANYLLTTVNSECIIQITSVRASIITLQHYLIFVISTLNIGDSNLINRSITIKGKITQSKNIILCKSMLFFRIQIIYTLNLSSPAVENVTASEYPNWWHITTASLCPKSLLAHIPPHEPLMYTWTIPDEYDKEVSLFRRKRSVPFPIRWSPNKKIMCYYKLLQINLSVVDTDSIGTMAHEYIMLNQSSALALGKLTVGGRWLQLF